MNHSLRSAQSVFSIYLLLSLNYKDEGGMFGRTKQKPDRLLLCSFSLFVCTHAFLAILVQHVDKQYKHTDHIKFGIFCLLRGVVLNNPCGISQESFPLPVILLYDSLRVIVFNNSV